MHRPSRLFGGEDADADCATFDGAGVGEYGDGVGSERRRYRQGRDRPDRCLGEPGAHAGHEGRHLPEARRRVGNLRHSGAGETLQAVISGSADIGIGIGTAGAMRAFARGAPVRAIAAAYVGVGDQYWYVPTNSPLQRLTDATEKQTMAYSTNG